MSAIFNNRELAFGFWFLVMLSFALTQQGIRQSLWKVVLSFLNWKIQLSIFGMVGYVGLVTLTLWLVGYWKVDLLKDTILWVAFGGFVLLFRYATDNFSSVSFRALVRDNIRMSILLEFVVNTYAFSLTGEVLFLPLVTTIAITDAVARSNADTKSVSSCTGTLLVVLGLGVLSVALWKAVADWENLATVQTLRAILLAPILSISFAPYLYLILLVAKYERAFTFLACGPRKSPSLISFARRRILAQFGFRLSQLSTFLESHRLELLQVQTPHDVDAMFESRPPVADSLN